MKEYQSAKTMKLYSPASSSDIYTGEQAIELAKYLLKNPTASEEELSKNLKISLGHHNSGVGDLKRFIKTILELGFKSACNTLDEEYEKKFSNA